MLIIACNDRRLILLPLCFFTIEKDLERLVDMGVIEPVTHSEWATPIVPVPKADGTIRICGDFKVTLNPALIVDQYPLPRLEDLFASLSGGQKFTKIDLSHAYQQLLLDEVTETSHCHDPSWVVPIQPVTLWGSLGASHLSEADGASIARSA